MSRAAATSRQEEKARMPRYIVERTFPDGLHIPVTAEGAEVVLKVVDRNSG